EFQYPRLGPGMMWRRAAELVESKGGAVELEWDAESIRHASGRVLEVVARHRDGRTRTLPASHVLSSMPISELVRKLDPAPPAEIRDAASRLTYRDFITVVLIVDRAELFPDNWIYVHTPDVKLGRVQNFKNWSPEMVPDPAKTSLGLEYFCSEGDELWRMSDAELVELGKREMQQIGLVRAAEVSDATVVRQRKAYPVYDATYATHLETLKRYLESFSNLHTMGRNGLHKYNNQDHSMLTAMLCVRNVLGEHHDVWDVNTERSYHEEVRIPKAAPA
ncbi:MAG TPA: FAD-dependent oxidoreductase, partial [Planctomycetota bacterium]|nr:FAD-dependent oxidoreductase [Planctomycetota bacterium]